MKNINKYSIMILLLLSLFACYDSSSEAPVLPLNDGDNNAGDQAVATDGKIYYFDNCAVCHAAGIDDNSSAFSATDLAKNTNITNNISTFDKKYNTMKRFNNLSDKRVSDLLEYLKNL